MPTPDRQEVLSDEDEIWRRMRSGHSMKPLEG
jgi:hypothetical protein